MLFFWSDKELRLLEEARLVEAASSYRGAIEEQYSRLLKASRPPSRGRRRPATRLPSRRRRPATSRCDHSSLPSASRRRGLSAEPGSRRLSILYTFSIL